MLNPRFSTVRSDLWRPTRPQRATHLIETGHSQPPEMLALSVLSTDLNQSDENKKRRLKRCIFALTFVLFSVLVILIYRYSTVASQIMVGVATPLFIGAILFECCCRTKALHGARPGQQCVTVGIRDFEEPSTTLLGYVDPQATLPPYTRVEEEPPQYDVICNGQTASYPGAELQMPLSYPDTSQPLESRDQEQTMQDVCNTATYNQVPPPPYEEAVSPVKEQ
ncbi:uncharacterized protein LOC118429261 isoform X1 [Branchiostoma floridae]|uniref:Uncharacterized protein LOC118429261 isoform X1 n=1 Tax=Branchiostoma floridae TaxID=7739 RepID=A0A9J7M735_BRAFL|nr:uncharacterized protein LOC118429261 isoform X1 [Branchiostoma floridae]